MFCWKCGAKLSQDAKFCENCGAPVDMPVHQPMPVQYMPAMQPPAGGNPSNVWVWLFALSPLLVTIAWALILPLTRSWFLSMGVAAAINIFAWLDIRELKRNNINTIRIWFGSWRPYLFERARRTNREYGPAVLWTVLCVITIPIDIWLWSYFGIW